MAKWITFRNSHGHLKLVFANVYTGQSEALGIMRSDTPDEMVIDWVIQQGNPSTGDIILLESGRVVQIVRDGGIV